jgi:hypothetical protein
LKCTIYVAVLDEGVTVWRPVDAEHNDDDTYVILEQPAYDPEFERWEFVPGDTVVCEQRAVHSGNILAAVRRART